MACILPACSDTGDEPITLYGVPMGSETASVYTSLLEHAQAVSTAYIPKTFLQHVAQRTCMPDFISSLAIARP